MSSHGFLGVIHRQIMYKDVISVWIQIAISIDLSIEFNIKIIQFLFPKFHFYSLTMLLFLPIHSTMQTVRLRFTVNGSSVFVREEKNTQFREYFSNIFKNRYFGVRALAYNRLQCVRFFCEIQVVSILHRCMYSIQNSLFHHTFWPISVLDSTWTKSQISKRTPSFQL